MPIIFQLKNAHQTSETEYKSKNEKYFIITFL